MENNLEQFKHNCTNSEDREILLITDGQTGEVMCSLCGQVLSDKIVELGSETMHGGEEYIQKSRTGAKSTLAFHDMGLSTLIEKSDKDSTGKSLSLDNKRTFYRLRMWDRNSKGKANNRNMQKAFSILEGLKSKLALSDATVERTAHIYRKILAKKICRGRSIPVILSATLYAACRSTNTPRTIQDISNAANLRRASVHRIYRILIQEMDLSPDSYSPISFISRIVTHVNASEKTRRDAVKIITKAESMMVTAGKNPVSVAAAAVYLASLKNNESITQTKIAKASSISSVTIRNLCSAFRSLK